VQLLLSALAGFAVDWISACPWPENSAWRREKLHQGRAMNHLQEVILDRLAGSEKIGRVWKTGPLGLAVQALQERKIITHSDAGHALGFPVMLCEAVQGASSVLNNPGDRCTLGVSFFSEIAPRDKQPRLSRQQHIRLAAWCVEQSHPLVCRSDCPYLQQTVQLARQFLEEADKISWTSYRSVESQCPLHEVVKPWPASWENSAQGRALLATRNTWLALYSARYTAPRVWTNKVSRDAARTAAYVQGVNGAVAFCLGLARQLGL
jgi:hypothetical protein